MGCTLIYDLKLQLIVVNFSVYSFEYYFMSHFLINTQQNVIIIIIIIYDIR